MNKSTVFSLLFMFFLAGISTAQNSISFVEKVSWKEALAKAAKENRIIFVDAYTTWCGPCKMMSRDVFTQENVAEFYNSNFVNLKIDMEKGEGPQLAQTYSVGVYPTLLFIDANGELLHRAAGYHDATQFIDLGKAAMDPSRQMGAYARRFEAGERDPLFLREYTEMSAAAYDGSHQKIADAYLETLPDWNNNDTREFIFRYVSSTEVPMFEHLVDHRKDYIAQFGERDVTSRLQRLIFSSVLDSKEQSSLEQVDALFKRVYPEKADQLSMNFRLSYYRQAGDRENFAKSAVKYYKKYPSQDAGELNDIAWTFYTVVDNKKQLKTAVKWAKKSIKLEPGYYNYDTLAALYLKLKKKKKGIKAAKKAITLAQESGADYSETQKLLDEIYTL